MATPLTMNTLEVTSRGRPVKLPSIPVLGVNVINRGSFLTTGQIFDEFWIERAALPDLPAVVAQLSGHPHRPDLLVYTQRVPDREALFKLPHESENFAVLPVSTFDRWFNEQIPSATRRNVRASEKRKVTVKACEFDDDYVAGIASIYNEAPIRAGRKYWHYGKALEAVRRENGTYAERSTFLAAYVDGEMVGYMKIVWDKQTGAIMQILSKVAVRDLRPNNALIAEAVRQACSRDVQHLIYEKFDYGNKVGDSLTRFKQANGFERMDVPRYYVPLTLKGRLALRLGLHRGVKHLIPESMASRLREWRSHWYERQAA